MLPNTRSLPVSEVRLVFGLNKSLRSSHASPFETTCVNKSHLRDLSVGYVESQHVKCRACYRLRVVQQEGSQL